MRSDLRLLLGETVKRAEAPDQFAAIDSDDATVRKAIAQDRQCQFVGGIGEGRNEYDVVCDVKVGVTRGQSHSVTHNFCRHRQRDDVELGARAARTKAGQAL